MAFKVVNDTVIHNNKLADVSDVTVDGTVVLDGDGAGNVTLKNVSLDSTTIDTDDLTEGTTNLYHTNERVDDRVAALIVGGTNITATYDDAANTLTIDATGTSGGGYDLSNNTSDEVAEGTTNLYHTDARALAATDGQEVKFRNLYNNLTDLPSAADYHGMFAHVHNEGKAYYAHAGNWVPLANETLTDTLITNSNRIAHADSGVVSHLNFTTTQFGVNNQTVLSSVKSINFFLDSNGGDSTCAFRIYNNVNPDSLGSTVETDHIFKVAENGDVSVSNDLTVAGDTIITGDLTVSGTTTTINTSELNIGDNIITLNSDETGTPSQNAGIEVERGTATNVAIRWNETSDAWEFTNDGTTYVAFGTSATFTGTTDGINEGTTNLYYTDARADARATLRINAATTDNISEGTGNLYFTNARAISALTSADVQTDSLGVGTAASGTTGEIRATDDVTAYYSSDASLKENVTNIENAIEKVQQMRGVEFDWTDEYLDAKGGEDDYFVRKHDVGVIAQEVEQVLPEVVATRENGIKAVKYDRITSLLIEAIKEQQSQIEMLKSEIKELRDK